MLRLLLLLAALSELSASPVTLSAPDRHAMFAAEPSDVESPPSPPVESPPPPSSSPSPPVESPPPPSSSPSPPVCDKPPITLAISGGGLRPMFAAMGLARALAETGLNDEIDLAGCNSGGCWFLTQWAYSKSTYDAISSPNVDLPGFITAWGVAYGDWFQEEVDKMAPWIDFDPFDDVSVGVSCKVAKRRMQKVMATLYEKFVLALDFPALEWDKFVGGMLIATNPELFVGMKFNAKRSAFNKADLLMTTGLTPDTWLDSTNNHVTKLLADGKKLDDKMAPTAYQYSTTGIPESSGWYESAQFSTQLGRQGEEVRLKFPSAPDLLDVAAGTSSIAGFPACPTGMNSLVKEVLSPTNYSMLIPVVQACLPFGFEKLSAPLIDPGASTEDKIAYRMLDGAYFENTALAFTIGKKTRQCAIPPGCVDPLPVILFDDGNTSSTTIQDGQSLRLLFAAKERPPGTYAGDRFTGLLKVPSPAAFEEEYPPLDQWTEYARFQVKEKRSGESHEVVSKYWEGVVTTIDNPAYGIKAGYKVNLLILGMDVPFLDVFIIMLPIFGDADYWRDHYGTMAQAQADGLVSVLQEWHKKLACATK